MANSEFISADRLREILHYTPETGVFRWAISPNKRIRVGDVAGTITSWGYTAINISGRPYKAHRLAFLYMRRWPEAEIDHVNRNKLDNRWCNLREATRAQNMANSCGHADSTSRIKGVSWRKDQRKWQARIQLNGKDGHLGYFDTLGRAFLRVRRPETFRCLCAGRIRGTFEWIGSARQDFVDPLSDDKLDAAIRAIEAPRPE